VNKLTPHNWKCSIFLPLHKRKQCCVWPQTKYTASAGLEPGLSHVLTVNA